MSLTMLEKVAAIRALPKWNDSKADYLDSLYADGLPTCTGNWIKGSGGHRVHEPCGKLATFADWDDTYSYCDAHISDHDREIGLLEVPWAALVRGQR